MSGNFTQKHNIPIHTKYIQKNYFNLNKSGSLQNSWSKSGIADLEEPNNSHLNIYKSDLLKLYSIIFKFDEV